MDRGKTYISFIFSKNLFSKRELLERIFTLSFKCIVIDLRAYRLLCLYKKMTPPIITQRENPLIIRIIIHNDHLGSTSVITNDSGAVVEQTFYDPYGAILSGGEVRYK